MSKMREFLFVLIIALMVSCVQARISPYPGVKYAPTDPSTVMIYNLPPPNPFEILGEVEGRGAPAASWASVENYMKKQAASIGGEAIVLIIRREPYAGTYTTASTANAFVYGNYIYYTYQPGTSFAMHRKNLVGLVIKWKKVG